MVQQLYLIGAFIQANVKHRVTVELDSRYGEYFLEYANILEDHWDQRIQCMVWIILEIYLLMKSPIGW